MYIGMKFYGRKVKLECRMEKNCEEKSSKLKFPKYPKGSVEIVFRNFETVEEVEKESDKFYRFYSINDDYFGKGNSRNIKKFIIFIIFI